MNLAKYLRDEANYRKSDEYQSMKLEDYLIQCFEERAMRGETYYEFNLTYPHNRGIGRNIIDNVNNALKSKGIKVDGNMITHILYSW